MVNTSRVRSKIFSYGSWLEFSGRARCLQPPTRRTSIPDHFVVTIKGVSRCLLLTHPGLEKWQQFTCLDSLRDVEPTVKLVIDDGGLDEIVEKAEEAKPIDGPEETAEESDGGNTA